MVSVTTWTSPAIDARIVALKQTGISHAQIAAVICREFDTFVTKNMVLRRSRTILGLDRGEKAANARLARRRKAEEAARMPKEPAPRPVNVPAPVVTLPPLASVAAERVYKGPPTCSFASHRPPLPPTGPVVPIKRYVADDGSWPTGPARHPCQFVTRSGSVVDPWIFCGLPVARGAWCMEHRGVVYYRARAA